MNWQLIESAPKDMQSILVFVPGTWELPDAYHVVFLKRQGTYVLQEDKHVIIDGATHWAELQKPDAAAR